MDPVVGGDNNRSDAACRVGVDLELALSMVP